MSKCISHTNLSNTLTLSECRDGWWLYDKTRDMNLAMRAKTSTDAFVEALEYYQDRLSQVEKSHSWLRGQVNEFVEQFVERGEDD